MKFKVQVGLKNTGYCEYQTDTYPQFDGGMVFIMCLDGTHIALPYREVDAVHTIPVPEAEEG